MHAILLAAGFGTRLKPLTEKIPKCLVPIGDQPILDIWMENLSKVGVEKFLINTHYLAEQVADYVEGSAYKKQVTLTFEPQLLGTAGTILANLNFFSNEDGLVVHADNYCLADIAAFIRAHKNRPLECLMTMLVFRTDNPSGCGIVEVDSSGIVQGFHEKVGNPPGNLANGAIYILSQELIEMLGKQYSGFSEFTVDIIPNLVGRIFAYETREVFIDIGTPEAYKIANIIKSKRA